MELLNILADIARTGNYTRVVADRKSFEEQFFPFNDTQVIVSTPLKDGITSQTLAQKYNNQLHVLSAGIFLVMGKYILLMVAEGSYISVPKGPTYKVHCGLGTSIELELLEDDKEAYRDMNTIQFLNSGFNTGVELFDDATFAGLFAKLDQEHKVFDNLQITPFQSQNE